MPARKSTAPTVAHTPTDSTDADLRRSLDAEERDAVLEYLTELAPIAGGIYPDEVEETMHRGRVAARRLANVSAKVLSPIRLFM